MPRCSAGCYAARPQGARVGAASFAAAAAGAAAPSRAFHALMAFWSLLRFLLASASSTSTRTISGLLCSCAESDGLRMPTAWQMAGRSLTRAARALVEVVKEILLALGDSAVLEAALLRLRDVIEKFGGTTNRKKEPSHAQLIEDPELLDWLCP